MPIEIDPNGTLTAEDYADEADAKAREERGDFKGWYTAQREDTAKALAETNNFRGQSGNMKAMHEEMKRFMQEKDQKRRESLSNLGGSPEETRGHPEVHKNAQGWLKMRGMDKQYKSFFEEDGVEYDFADPVGTAAKMGVNVQSPDDLIKAGEFGEYLLGRAYQKNPSPENLERWIKVNEGPMLPIQNMNRGQPAVGDFQNAMHLGGPKQPTDEQKAEAIDVEFPLAKGKGGGKVDYHDVSTLDMGGDQSAPKSAYDRLEELIMSKDLDSKVGPVQALGMQTGQKLLDMLVVSPYKAIEALLNPMGYLPGAGDQQAVARSTEAAGAIGGASTLIPAPKGSLRVFGGRAGAEYAASKGHGGAKEMLDIADSMYTSGHSDFTIRETLREASEAAQLGGWSRGKAGHGQFEISDAGMGFKMEFDKIPPGQHRLGDILHHPELEKYYPEVMDLPIVLEKANPKFKGYRPGGGYDPRSTGDPFISVKAQNAEQFLDVITHEVDHALADIEFHPSGGNSKSIKPLLQHAYGQRIMELEDLVAKGLADPSELRQAKAILKDINSATGQSLYVRSAGENRANAAQKRREMTNKERIDQDPRRDETVTREWQIEHGFEEGAIYFREKADEAAAARSDPRAWEAFSKHPDFKKWADKKYLIVDTGANMDGSPTVSPVGSARSLREAIKKVEERGGDPDRFKIMTPRETADAQWPNIKAIVEFESKAKNASEVAKTGKHGSLPDEGKFRRLMGEQYKIAEAGDDWGTMRDILQGRLANDQNMPQPMREAMELKIAQLENDLGPEWMAKYGGGSGPQTMESSSGLSGAKAARQAFRKVEKLSKEIADTEEKIASGRYYASALDTMKRGLENKKLRLQEEMRRAEEARVAGYNDTMFKEWDTLRTRRGALAETPLEQGVPNTLEAPSVGRGQKGPKVMDRVETLLTVIKNEPDMAKVEAARQELIGLNLSRPPKDVK